MPTNATGIAVYGATDEAAPRYITATKRLIYRLREQMKWNGVQVLGTQLRLDGNTYAYVYAYQGTTRAVIVSGYDQTPDDDDSPEPTPAPDFVSGFVHSGTLEDGRLQTFKPTTAAARLHRMRSQFEPSARFAVGVHPDVPEIDKPDASPPISQYHKGKSTNWTGAMRVVVQAIQSVGKASAPSIYDKVAPPVLDPTQRIIEPTAYEERIAASGVMVRYGARFERTHGITMASDGKPWLIEISITRGVLAMPLPLFPSTTLERFRDRLERLEDEDAIDLIERFGGFPSGEIFPNSDEALEAAIRGGFVQRLLSHSDLSGFYEHISYSPAMSWAFSDTGHDAVTSCWRYGEDGYQRASWWGVSLSVAATIDTELPRNASALRQAMAEQGYGEAHTWILRKIDRLTEDQVRVLARSASTSKPRAYAELDALVLDPIATASARLSKRGEGKLWVPFTAKRFPPIAYYHPFVGFCVTHDPRPAWSMPRPVGTLDTVMWVAYQGQTLAWVRYFDDARDRAVQIDSDFEDCMYIGTFSQTVSTNAVEPSQTFYSNRFDDRQQLATSRTKTTREGRDLGYTRVGVRNSITYPPEGELLRERAFRITVTIESFFGEDRRVGIVLPAFDRCAYYYAIREKRDGYSKSVGKSTESLNDPWSYGTWRNFPGFTGSTSGGIYRRADHPDGCGPVDANTVRSIHTYAPYLCSDFADQGSWASVCDNADAMTRTSALPPNQFSITTEPAKEILTAWLVNASEIEELRVASDTKTNPDHVDASWFITSPDPDTFEQIYMESWHNCWGDALGVAYYTTAVGAGVGQRLVFAQPTGSDAQIALDNGLTYSFIGRIG